MGRHPRTAGRSLARRSHSFDPGRHQWSVTAVSPKYSGRLRPPAAVVGEGEDEMAALTDLVLKLRDLRDVERRMALEAKVRAAYLEGAAEDSQRRPGRPLTREELDRVLRRFPGR
jgi:hypothetical protein